MAKQFSNKTSKKKIKKKRNEHNRLRDIIVNFRVSPQEKEILDARIFASGMTKQNYYRQSCLYQKILVTGNIRSFDRIRKAVGEIAATLKVNPNYEGLTLEQQSMLKTILEILDRLYGYDSRTLGLRQASHSCTHERSLSGSCPNPQSPPGGDPSC